MTDTPTAAVAPALARRTAEQLLHHRILLLDSPLDDENGSQLCAQLALLSAEDPRTDIALWIHSPGGSVSAMLAIADTMRMIPNDVRTLALGMAYSAGQFLLCCGTPGKRFALPHAKVLLHQGSAGIGGYAPDVELQADDLRLMRDTVIGIIAERTGQTSERVFEDSLRDRTYTAHEALDYGFVDEVLSDLGSAWPRSVGGVGLTFERCSVMSSYTIPSVVTRSPRGDRVTDVYSRLLEERVVYLGTELDDGVANALIAQILHLESEQPDTPIHLYLNSPGGSVTATFAVYDTMQYCRAPVTTTCVGQAFSSTALLLAAGDPGQRAVLPHARVLLHQPAGQGRGAIPDLILAADELLAVRTELEEAMSRHTGQSVETLRRDTDRDRILRAAEVVEYGVADRVITSR